MKLRIPEHLRLRLDSYRIENHVNTTVHYLAAGRQVEAWGATSKRMAAACRAGEPRWHQLGDSVFDHQDGAMRLRAEHYHAGPHTLKTPDLRVLLQTAEGEVLRSWELDLHILAQAMTVFRRGGSLDADAARWVQELAAAGGLTHAEETEASQGIRLLGHAGVDLTTASARILVDPILTMRHSTHNILHALDGQLDAVVLTHPRWDHTCIDTLLHVPRTTPVVCAAPTTPASLDNPDLPRLLAELGFTDIRLLTPWQSLSLGDLTLTRCPWRGDARTVESPTDAMSLHIGGPGQDLLLAGEATADGFGSFDNVVREIASRLPVSLLLASYTAYHTPIAWFTRRPFRFGPGLEQATTSATDAQRWATMLGATWVPYAGFAFTAQDRWRLPSTTPGYGGIERRGSLVGADLSRARVLSPGEHLPWDPQEARQQCAR